MKPQTTLESFEQFNKSCGELVKAIKEELHLTTLLDLWNNDLQLWTGYWWWMETGK